MASLIERVAPNIELSPDPTINRIMAARGIETHRDMEHYLQHVNKFESLPDIDHAVYWISTAIRMQWLITIVGDYDCDGATGTATGYRGLKALGAKRVKYLVPDRNIHGYGLSPLLVESVDPETGLLITVDNGSSAIDGVASAKTKGMRVVVTDHHLAGETLPDCDALVNPNIVKNHPLKHLCGAGVMLFVLCAVRQHLRKSGFYTGKLPDLTDMVSLVAIGTVADLVSLDHTNRCLVQAGLSQIQSGKMLPGIRQLTNAVKKKPPYLTATDISFAIAPVINSVGRLEDMKVGVECLVSDDDERVGRVVRHLVHTNAYRREQQALMVEEAQHMVKDLSIDDGHGIVVFQDNWHSGIVGLIASALKQKLNRPVFALAKSAPDSSELRGSGRSIEGIHLRDVLAQIDVESPGMFMKFGGHAMAAGLSLHQDNIESFRLSFNRIVGDILKTTPPSEQLFVDGSLPPTHLTLDFALKLAALAPWGQGFPEPIFVDIFDVIEARVLKDRYLKLSLSPIETPVEIEAMWFDWDQESVDDRVEIAYTFNVSTFRKHPYPQILIKQLKRVC